MDKRDDNAYKVQNSDVVKHTLFSLIYLNSDFEKKIDMYNMDLQNFMKESINLSEEIRIAEINNFLSEAREMKSNYNNQMYFIISTSVILIVFSSILITQGQVNMVYRR